MANDIILSGNNEIVEQNPITVASYERFLGFIDVKPRTVDTYRKAIKQFLVYVNTNGISQPTREDIIAYREYLKENHKPATVQTYITAVKLFFSWLDQEGIYKNVANKVKGAKIDRGHKKDYLTARQTKKVLKSVDQTSVKGLRDYAILSLMVTAGLRTIEVVRADVSDLRTLGDYTVLYVQGKGKDQKTDYVKVAPQVEDAIRAYLTERGAKENEPLFTSTSRNNYGERMTTRSISGIVKTHLVEAGFNSDRLTAHSLRHTAGTLNILNGGTLDETQQLLRHSNINTTMIYLHSLDRAKNNSEARVANAIF